MPCPGARAWKKASECLQAVPEAGASFQKVGGAEDVEQQAGEPDEADMNEKAGDKSPEDESSDIDEVSDSKLSR
eukprot:9719100-Alexandrium_andersonii.AAC.1